MANAELTTIRCWCGLPFALPASLLAEARGDPRVTFYCPIGHGNHYAESEADKFRREAERLRQQIAMKDDELRDERQRAKRSVAAYKGEVTKLRTRAKAGSCPCCNRTFQDLHRHMATKHPDFDPAENVVPFEGKAS